MRATNYKHYGSECKTDKKAKKVSRSKSRKGVKAFSFGIAISLAAVALIVPTTTLAPDVDAFEDKKAASYTVGDIDEFAVVISDNCIQETTVPLTQETTTVPATTKATETVKNTEPATEAEVKKAESKPTEAVKAESVTKTPVTNTGVEKTEETIAVTKPQTTVKNDGYLIGISNPDSNYNPKAVTLSDYDRAKLERLVMGEAGSMGYNGCALVAQCIRDAMNRSNTTSIDSIISEYKYYAPTNKEPNQTVKDAVAYIFDQNGSAVQHRILCFYTGQSGWHETQNFIVGYQNVRFFDLNCA